MVIQERTLPPVTRQQIARYAGAVRDFNPMHVDEEFAKSVGMPSVIAHGPLTLARGLDAIMAQVGVNGIRRVEARFKAPYVPGEALTLVPTEAGFELRTGSGAVVMTALLELSGEHEAGEEEVATPT